MEDKKVAAEYNRLLTLFDGADANKMDFIRENVRQLAWYNARISELQERVDNNGMTIEYQNGRNQHGLQNNPDLKALVELQKLASAMVKIMLPLVPEGRRGMSKLDALRNDLDLPLDLEKI